MKGLFWFRHDLRLGDNPALLAMAKHCNRALMIYVIDPQWFKPTDYQTKPLGKYRAAFLYQSLRALQAELKKRNQKLVLKVGDPLTIIPRLCDKHQIDLVATTEHPGVYERQQLAFLRQTLDCQLHVNHSFTLFLPNQLHFDFQQHHTFERFKTYVTDHHILPSIPVSAPDELPQRIEEGRDVSDRPEFFYDLSHYQGGEDPAYCQLNRFIWKTQGLKDYAQLHWQLDGWSSSSKLSAWLANGCLSVRSLAAEIDNYEYRYGKSESTQRLFNQLLRREYLQWMLYHHNAKWFAFGGINNNPPLTHFYPERFKAWQQGKTEHKLVNACMQQLLRTGYLSAKGRQLSAHYLVNELNVDWRFGAAYFEQQLIDFDVASNFGNWQQIAGVGFDYPPAYLEHSLHSESGNAQYIQTWLSPSFASHSKS